MKFLIWIFLVLYASNANATLFCRPYVIGFNLFHTYCSLKFLSILTHQYFLIFCIIFWLKFWFPRFWAKSSQNDPKMMYGCCCNICIFVNKRLSCEVVYSFALVNFEITLLDTNYTLGPQKNSEFVLPKHKAMDF